MDSSSSSRSEVAVASTVVDPFLVEALPSPRHRLAGWIIEHLAKGFNRIDLTKTRGVKVLSRTESTSLHMSDSSLVLTRTVRYAVIFVIGLKQCSNAAIRRLQVIADYMLACTPNVDRFLLRPTLKPFCLSSMFIYFFFECIIPGGIWVNSGLTTITRDSSDPVTSVGAVCHGWAKMVRLTLEEW
ncbi:hypothetical protein AKJ16_DCAP12186 [Drosera capensis]